MKMHLVLLALQQCTWALLSISCSVGAAPQKQPPHTELLTYFPVTSWQGRITVFTKKDLWSNASQATKASGLNDQITVRHGGHLHLNLALSTCEPIAQDAF